MHIQKNTNSVSIAYIGDGGVEEGVFHESLNLASINNLPVIFVVENNLFQAIWILIKGNLIPSLQDLRKQT